MPLAVGQEDSLGKFPGKITFSPVFLESTNGERLTCMTQLQPSTQSDGSCDESLEKQRSFGPVDEDEL